MGPSCEPVGQGLRELQVRPALVHHDPAALDGVLDPGSVLIRRTLHLKQEGPVDLLDMDAPILHRLDAVGDRGQLAGAVSGSEKMHGFG